MLRSAFSRQTPVTSVLSNGGSKEKNSILQDCKLMVVRRKTEYPMVLVQLQCLHLISLKGSDKFCKNPHALLVGVSLSRFQNLKRTNTSACFRPPTTCCLHRGQPADTLEKKKKTALVEMVKQRPSVVDDPDDR